VTCSHRNSLHTKSVFNLASKHNGGVFDAIARQTKHNMKL